MSFWIVSITEHSKRLKKIAVITSCKILSEFDDGFLERSFAMMIVVCGLNVACKRRYFYLFGVVHEKIIDDFSLALFQTVLKVRNSSL